MVVASALAWTLWLSVATTIARLAHRDWKKAMEDNDVIELKVVIATAGIFALILAAGAVAILIWL